MFSRLLFGARISLFVATIAVVFGLFAGTLTGIVAGYYGGLIDEVLMRLVDLWASLPFLLIALIVAISVGPSFGMALALVWRWLGLALVWRWLGLALAWRWLRAGSALV